MQKHVPTLICFCLALVFSFVSYSTAQSEHFNTYPNLPAPIAEEKILITSAGQAAENIILLSVAEKLNLEADYRPRALGTDLYDYNSVVIMLGSSANGLSHTGRSFQEELSRVSSLIQEADAADLPVILINVSAPLRHHVQTRELFEQIAPSTDYFIGLRSIRNAEFYIQTLRNHSVPVTLITRLDDIHTPFNAIFR
ncbi:DUF6305 family protein [Lentibacillus juripiscarius]|uniref:DUF6305 family protein n=1 Tax=Lentibacillus juripiscarius TaxID=257446 RepID=A0ABW5V6V3_9BACI